MHGRTGSDPQRNSDAPQRTIPAAPRYSFLGQPVNGRTTMQIDRSEPRFCLPP